MAVTDQILQILEPKIAPPSIDVVDFESNESDSKIRQPESSGYASQLGKKAPLVKIGNTRLQSDSVIGMSVYADSLLPRIHVSVLDTSGSLTSVGYPRTNPLLTVYVASTNKKLKSFSQTFLITSVNSIPFPDKTIRYDFYGELYVPKMNGNFIKSYPNVTSSQALKKIAEELGLGFATNEDSTSDQMTWINPNLNYKSFIKQVTDHSYKNETSFFDCFIDRYYVLNFINVEKQFKQFGDDSEIPETYPSYSSDYLDTSRADVTADGEEATVPLILTNAETGTAYSDLKILEHSMISENGDVLNRDGFRKRVMLYTHGEDQALKDWFSEPLSQVSPDGVSLYQRPELPDYLDNPIVKWMGTDYKNAHINYKFAKIINTHNRLEAEKNALRVKVPGFNMGILRGSRIKVEIYSARTKRALDQSMSDDKSQTNSQEIENGAQSSATDLLIDPNLTDTYYVKELVYTYNPSQSGSAFTTEIILSKRNWLPNQLMENIT
jgi:hypothetical protein